MGWEGLGGKGWHRKKVLSLVLCVAVMLSVMVVGAGAAFSDQSKIKNTEAVDACVALNIIGGYGDNTYRPENNITRAEVCKMICVALNGGKEPTLSVPATPTFKDVRNDANSSWAEKYIESCVAQGIVGGVGNGMFQPSQNVTGSQLAKMLLVALGYKSEIEGFGGNGWDTQVNVVATQKDLYEDLESIDVSAALTRDSAAQMIWNALQAVEVEYKYTLDGSNGQLTSKADVVDKTHRVGGTDVDTTLLWDKYGASVVTGVVTEVGHTSKGYTATVDPDDAKADNINLTKIANDPTEFVGKAVKVMYKANDDVCGIYVNTENTDTVVETTLGDIDLSKNEYKLDGVTYKTKATNFGAVEAVTTLGKDASATKTTLTGAKYSPASKVVLIDNTGDEKIDIAVITPVKFGEITYMNANNITVKGVLTNQKLEDCDIYSGAAKDDQVAVIEGKYVADGDIQITKLDVVNGKVDASKTGEARIGGTWYDVSSEVAAADVKIDAKGDFFLYNGYIVAVDATGASIADTAYLISSGETMDVDGNYQAKVMMNGETKLVTMKDTASVDHGDADVYVTYEVDDGVYKFTKIDAGEMSDDFDEYTASAVAAYEDARFYQTLAADGKTTSGTEYLIDDDAVFYVRYDKDSNGDYEYAILSGKDVAGWGNKVKATGTDSLVLTKTNDSMNKIKGAFIDLDTQKMPASTVSYGVIVSDVVKAADSKYEFTLWNGTEQIEVVTSDSGFAKWQAVEYAKNSDGTYAIDAVKTPAAKEAGVTTGFDQYSIMDHTSSVVQLANVDNAAKNYNITKDTQIIYVDTSADGVDTICVNGGSIENASAAENGKYYRNASFVVDDGSDLALLIVLVNTDEATAGTIATP